MLCPRFSRYAFAHSFPLSDTFPLQATAVLFAKCGANVILTARRADALAEALKECEQANKAGGSGAGGKYATLELDMRDRKALDAVLNKLPVWAKEVDVLGE